MKRKVFVVLAALAAGCSNPAAPVLPVHQPGRVIGAQDVGPVDGAEEVDLVLALKRRNPNLLTQAMHELADPNHTAAHHPYQPTAFGDSFGATPSDYNRVLQWCADNNLQVTRVVDSRTSITIHGTVAQVESAFGTHLRWYRDSRGTFRAPTADLTGWNGISDVVAGVVGLDTAGQWRSHRIDPPPSPNRTNGSLDPVDLSTQYQVATSGLLGDGQTVAILGTGFNPDPQADVTGYINHYHLPVSRTAQYNQVFLGGPNRDNTNLANNEYGENLLDIDMVFGLAPHASVVHVFTAQNGGGLFADGIVFIVNQVPNAHSVSVSYGTCERVAETEITTLNLLFQQAKMEGQQWFFSSGDDGTDGCRDGAGNQVLSVDWPSSSPYALGVGGTELDGAVENAWGGAGGGESEIIAKPAFQEGVGPFPDDGRRQVPDIAALAGNPGVSTYAQGQIFGSEGTSASSPMWAAMWALIDESQGGGGITNGAEILYGLGKQQQAGGPAVFHDIVNGGNPGGGAQGYTAGPGYDLITGWGTPNVTALIANWTSVTQ